MKFLSNASTDGHDGPVICELVHTLNVGGAEVLAREFALKTTGNYRFVFACLDECGIIGDGLRGLGYPVAVLERQPGLDLGCVRRLARYCREQGAKLIHAHQYGPFFYASLASRLAGRIPVLFTEHGRDYPDYPRMKRMLANRLLLRRRDRVVAVGNGVREALVANEGIARPRIQVVYNGIDLEHFGQPTSDRDAVRAELGMTSRHLMIVQVARLNRLKDHATAIRAMLPIAAEFPHARLVLVGEGEERSKLAALVADLGLGDSVLFAGLRQDLPRLLAASDIFLLSSISEGIPLTLLEAMAASLPCVATRVGGVPEIIVDGRTGILAEAANPPSIAEGLRTLVTNPELRRRMGAAGKERAWAKFDARQMHDAYDRIFHEMAEVTQCDSRHKMPGTVDRGEASR